MANHRSDIIYGAFATLAEANNCAIEVHKFGITPEIKFPDGEWHKWKGEKS
jgi:hypothetical protein